MTTLVRWSPFQELDAMERRMRRIFGDIGLVPATLPATDVYETEKEFVLEIEAPGFEEKELTIGKNDELTKKKTKQQGDLDAEKLALETANRDRESVKQTISSLESQG